MKKILNILSIICLIIPTSISVVACNNITKDKSANKIEETAELLKFAISSKEHITKDQINLKSIKFKNSSVKDNTEIINFNLNLKQDLKSKNHSQLLKHYKGIIDYNVKNKIFTLEGQPFTQYNYIPGFFYTSIWRTSIITGTPNDFIIAANSNQLQALNTDLGAEGATSLLDLFNRNHWNNYTKWKNGDLKLSNLQKLIKGSLSFLIPENYTAVIHVVNNKIIWSNLVTKKTRSSLRAAGDGRLSSYIIKNNQSELSLWLSNDLVQEINQLYLLNPSNNQWFDSINLQHWLTYNSNNVDLFGLLKVGLQVCNVKTTKYQEYNATWNDGINAIQNLVSSWSNIAKFQTCISQNKNKGYVLRFNKNLSQNNWEFQWIKGIENAKKNN